MRSLKMILERRVLVASDKTSFATNTILALEEYGLQVDRATTTEDAVRYLLVNSYGILVSQIVGTGVDGERLMRIAKGRDEEDSLVMEHFGELTDLYGKWINSMELMKILSMDPCRHLTGKMAKENLSNGDVRVFKDYEGTIGKADLFKTLDSFYLS